MRIYLSILFIFVYFNKLNGEDIDVDVIKSEMTDSMQKYAVGETLVLLSDDSKFEDVASSLIDNLNRRYGKEWVVLIGTNLHPLIIGMSIINNTYLLLEYKNNHILMFKQFDQSSVQAQVSVQEAIVKANSAAVSTIQTTDQIAFGKITALAQQVLKNDYTKCDSNPTSVDVNHWCYKEMSTALIDAINNAQAAINGTVTDTYTATVGNLNRCFSYSLGLNITEAHIFKIADIYFEVRKYHI